MTDQLTTANNNRDLLTTAIGPTVGYHISQCVHGGYIITVDGRIHAACTTLVEAMAAMGRVAAAQYNETSEPSEQATDVTPRMPRHLERAAQAAANGEDRAGEPDPPPTGMSRFPATVSLVMMTLAAGAAYVWGP